VGPARLAWYSMIVPMRTGSESKSRVNAAAAAAADDTSGSPALRGRSEAQGQIMQRPRIIRVNLASSPAAATPAASTVSY
jgi:hypothetical protein